MRRRKPSSSTPMTPLERRSTRALASVYGLRMLGMFIILPVFALYAETLPGGRDRTMVGIALGAYGLAQALLQIPFGWASDRYGRKRTIYAGLIIFAAGSFLAAAADTIEWVIAGRVLQGAGAISAAVIALLADLTREGVRTKAMALVGMTIGLTFAASLAAGPALQGLIGVPGIFVMTGVLAMAAIAVVRWSVPDPVLKSERSPLPAGMLKSLLGDGQLMRLNYGIFALHASLMAMFVQVPFALRDTGLPVERHWYVYLPVLAISFLLMMPALMQSDRRDRSKPIFVGAVAMLLISEILLSFALNSIVLLFMALLVFFTAFNLLEATLPSLITKFAPPAAKGTAIGIYSSVQFVGIFVGAAAGGWLSQHVGAYAVFVFCSALVAIWLLISLTMTAPPTYNNQNYLMGEPDGIR